MLLLLTPKDRDLPQRCVDLDRRSALDGRCAVVDVLTFGFNGQWKTDRARLVPRASSPFPCRAIVQLAFRSRRPACKTRTVSRNGTETAAKFKLNVFKSGRIAPCRRTGLNQNTCPILSFHRSMLRPWLCLTRRHKAVLHFLYRWQQQLREGKYPLGHRCSEVSDRLASNGGLEVLADVSRDHAVSAVHLLPPQMTHQHHRSWCSLNSS